VLFLIVHCKYNWFSCFKYNFLTAFSAPGQGSMTTRKIMFSQQKHHRGEGDGCTITLGLLSQKAFYRSVPQGRTPWALTFAPPGCLCALPRRGRWMEPDPESGSIIIVRFCLGAAAADLPQADCSTTKSIDISSCFIGGILTSNMVILSPDKSETGPLSEASKWA
jgi:hypothetical protein